MGNTLFISPWVDDAEYIVNLTKNVVGERTLSKLGAEGAARKGRAVLLVLTPRIVSEVMKMTSETLGRICAYGTERGFHHGPPVAASFLNLTGYQDIVVDGMLNLRSTSGRELLELEATFTITCVARDIAMQSEWQVKIARELESHEDYERGMEDYIHGRS